MKFVSMDKIYELSDEVGSAYVDVCLIDNELATERVIPIEILQEIRQEIVGFRDDAEIRYGHQLGFDKIYAYERCIDLIDVKIKELSE